MNLYEYFKSRCKEEDENNKDSFLLNLVSLVDRVIADTKAHLNLVTVVLPAFDKHNSEHSERVMDNMYKILYNKLEQHNPVELAFYILSSYLHDCGMALPKWELTLLKSTEGTDEFFDDTFEKPISNDGKQPYTITQAISYIRDNENLLFASEDDISNFIFNNTNKDKFIDQLAQSLIEYQKFRNGFIDVLKGIRSKPEYTEKSKQIRYEFVRRTHAERAERYIKNAEVIFANKLGGSWGAAFAKDIAKVCRSHCKDYNYCLSLKSDRSYYGYKVNLQFASLLLRLADVLHYSDDRVNKSYYAEMMIFTNDTNSIHWISKFGVKYNITTEEVIKISFEAFCKDPNVYYFLKDVINFINSELLMFKNYCLNYKGSDLSKYYILIEETVDDTNISADTDYFEPVDNKGFVLEQNQIMQLLMGVGLYKDKNLCIRELYQNSLDACRCMIAEYASDNLIKQGTIEFGISTDEKGTFLYCQDNGTGMSRKVIDEYFLRIGKSYYKSSEYQILNINKKYNYKPNSCFGIGILSCFMLGSDMEVITIFKDKDTLEATHFVINGPNSKIYRIPFTFKDEELIGAHGTIIKIYLDSSLQYNNNYNLNNDDILCCLNSIDSHTYDNDNLFIICNSLIGIQDSNIDVSISTQSGKKKLFNYYDVYYPKDYYIWRNKYKYSFDKMHKSIYFNNSELERIYNKNIKKINSTNTYNIKCECDGLELFTCISLSTKINCVPDLCPSLLCDFNILVDGINITPLYNKKIKNQFNYDIFNNNNTFLRLFYSIKSIINISNKFDATLSIDRLSITQISDKFYNIVNTLFRIELVDNIYEIFIQHYKKYGKNNSNFFTQLTSSILEQFSDIKIELLRKIISNNSKDIILNYLSVKNMNELFKQKEFEIYPYDFSDTFFHMFIRQKLKGADVTVCETKINVKNANINVDVEFKKNIYKSNIDEYNYIISSQIFMEYDMVNIFPNFVSTNMYNNILCTQSEYIFTDIKDFIVWTNPFEINFAILNSLSIYNISLDKKIYYFNDNKITPTDFVFYNHTKNYYYCPYLYVDPSKPKSVIRLSKIDIDNEYLVYNKVETNGWSILFLGQTDEYVMLPGKHNVENLIKIIPDIFFKKYQNRKFVLTNGQFIN